MVSLAMQFVRTIVAVGALAGFWLLSAPTSLIAEDSARRPINDDDMRFWLQNMLVHHKYSAEEVGLATGLSADEIAAAVERLKIKPTAKREPGASDPLLALPYPGGRHPRIGFLDGAIDPQRETKVSVFAPWDDGGYAVADVPEAIWMQTEPGRELLYLAHTHVATHWTKKELTLERLEWKPVDGGWRSERKLPNSVVFGTHVRPGQHGVRMESWLTNGTDQTLRGLVVQNCVMLIGLRGFDQQTNDNKLLRNPYVACHNADKTRWIITAWQPTQRVWGNPPCPCLHSDPKFPDCEPGQTVRIHGWLSFYEGETIDEELKRLDPIRANGL